ncbi:MAG: 50S ribosomal protein L34, partial [Marinobacter adhaerens]
RKVISRRRAKGRARLSA